ncbi:predicted metal-dependent phosphoesterase, PHP family [Sanguibacter keddieii DSM 10542]|uniref:Predicted metal-dependent phosphoesterase, PHP family n=1 Tax=Sanguibacter keddieii (strain ATCC 51767 / DSM 10542 / NCFB 3025 / ST-74) TaxID=446469 RepID=D1BAY0_SANKS|nr:PHP domain-containing protein [Sanguibacter keddieii]ACZ22681.1 predicted metal-dependent phosphoesterase, PHP family [Sanguibacter keddieii DSM 10542]
MPRDLLIDLHTHSNASDGTESPAGVVGSAAAAGLDVVALTDHDTTAGWDEAAEAALRSGVALVRGTEVSARSAGISVHLLSYLHDPTHPALVAQNDEVRLARSDRARTMVRLLGRDFDVTWDDVLAQTEPGTTIGRPHIADALVHAGYAPDRSAAFATILRTGSDYYVPHYAPDALDAIRAVRAAGGVPVFAHPGADGRGRVVGDEVIEEMAAAGLLGLEVQHRDNGPEQQRRLTMMARSLDLFVTGSSDYHGAGKPNRLGENTTDPAVLALIEEIGRSDVIRP